MAEAPDVRNENKMLGTKIRSAYADDRRKL